MQASATAVFRSSIRSEEKPMSSATLAAVLIATFSKPSRVGKRNSVMMGDEIISRPGGSLIHAAQVEGRHVVRLAGVAGESIESLPYQVQKVIGMRTIHQSEQAIFAELLVATKNFRQSIGIEQQLAIVLDFVSLGFVSTAGQHTQRRAAGCDPYRLADRSQQKRRIMACVDCLY